MLLNRTAVSVNPNEMSAVLPRCFLPHRLFELCLHFLLELFFLKRGDVENLLAVPLGAERDLDDEFTLITADLIQSSLYLPFLYLS